MLWRDIRLSLRSLANAPAFTAVAVVTLAIGIGSTTTIFSVVDAVVLTPLPYPNAHELVSVRTEMTDGRETTGGVSPYALTRMNERSANFSSFAGAYRFEVAVRDLEDRPLKTAAYIATEGYFDILGSPIALGRSFLPEEHLLEPTTAILSHGLWQSAFNGDPSIIGRSIPSGTGSLIVVGVTTPDHDLPAGADIWLAYRPDPNMTAFFLEGLARLSPGTTLQRGRTELATMATRLEEETASFRGRTLAGQDLQEAIVGDASTKLFILLGSAAILLLIACANVMNLVLSRGESKGRQVALRAALGAKPSRLVRELLVESMVLSGLGALVGLGATWSSLKLVATIGLTEFPRAGEIGIDGSVLLFAVGATAVTGLLFGLLPALRLAATDIRSLMGGGTRGSSGSRRSRQIFAGLVAGQTGLSVALVIGAGLLLRSFQRLQEADGGFESEGVLVMDANLPRSVYPDEREVARMYEQLIDEIEDLPGVETVGATSTLPLGEHLDFFLSTTVEGLPATDEPERSRFRQVTPGFFGAARLDLLEGRFLEDSDRVDSRGVAVVNEAFVSRFLDGMPALGQRLRPGSTFLESTAIGRRDKEYFEIVGVVGDVRYIGLDTPGEPSLYVPHDQAPFRRMFVTVKFDGVSASTLTTGMRDAFRGLDPTLPVEFTSMDDVVAASLASERMTMLLLLAFALSAVVLAAVGLYGVIAYGVRERTTEMAVRRALGASSKTVVKLAMVRGLGMALFGVFAGVVVAILAKNVMATQLYEISATDPLVVVGAPMLLSLVAFVAVLLPALRVTRINLSKVLRDD